METTTPTNGTPSLEKRLHEPDTAAALNRLLDRLDTIERAVDTLERIETQLPGALSTATDVVDAELTRAADRGVVLDERMREGLAMLEAITEPSTARALTALAERSDQIEKLVTLADAAPDAIATVVDVLDAEYARLAEQGFEPEQAVRDAAGALGRLSELFRTDEFQALLDSGVLDPKALRVVGSLASALVESQSEADRGETPQRGLFGLVGALRDPDVQRAIGFLTGVAKRFGQNLR